MEEVFIWVDGVRGHGRPRHTKSGITYTDKKDKDYRKAIRAAYTEAGGASFDSAPVSVHIGVYMPLPKSRPKRIECEPNTVKPDADNIAKAVMDALNGLAYKDDKQVTRLVVSKFPRKRNQSAGISVLVKEDKKGL